MDSSGAGDAFFATLIGLYLEGKTFEEAIPICNCICGMLAAKRGVNIMRREDLDMAKSLMNYPL
jgi:sugar/nucleoside kinase (ribokinase family)